jgi:hypothetical protein
MKTLIDAIYDSNNSDYENSITISKGGRWDEVTITLSNPSREIIVNRFVLKKALRSVK